MVLPATSQAPSLARGALVTSLADASEVARATDAELLVSELVTNCVRHAGLKVGEPISFAVDITNGQLRVEIADHGAGFAPLTTTGVDGEGTSGWGLMLVEQLADDWGIETGTDDGTRIWFEMQL
jgi:anti-sigma regulatory factor (Ser/Thr protein kinase)